jgi:DNA topoisomerase-6 subunit B
VCAIIPEIAEKVSEIVELPVPDISPIEGRIMRKMVVKKRSSGGTVTIELNNYTEFNGTVSVYETSPDNADDAEPKADFITSLDTEFTKVWQVPLTPGASWKVTWKGRGGGNLDIRGIDEGKLVVVDLNV